MHPKEKQHKIQTLAERLCRSRNVHSTQFNEMTVTHSDWSTSVDIDGTTVYRRQRDQKREQKSMNREMSQFNVGLKGTAKYYTVDIWELDMADKAIELLEGSLVLELLAEETRDLFAE